VGEVAGGGADTAPPRPPQLIAAYPGEEEVGGAGASARATTASGITISSTGDLRNRLMVTSF
jgi:hypothetical protein